MDMKSSDNSIYKKDHIYNILKKMDLWIKDNKFSGYDPYDIKAIPVILNITKWGNNNRLAEILREIVFELGYTFPIAIRKILSVEKKTNPKALGLLASAYLKLYKLTNQEQFVTTSNYCLEWLSSNAVYYNGGMGWGYPFDWQSAKKIPANTPNGIVTTAVAQGYWEWYKYTNNQSYLDVCEKICVFLSSLPKDEMKDGSICFSYTPLFVNHVHNLNLFVAEILLKTGLELNRSDWVDLALRSVKYTINNQLENGAFDYNGPPEKPQNFVDHYHTGFVLRMLYSIWNITKDSEIYAAFKRGFNFYINNFFYNETIPKLLPDRLHRIDIHSCAESITCLSKVSDTFPEGIPILNNVLQWTIENLYSDKGYFYYGILKSRFTKQTFVSRIPYFRWGQAWMFLALSEYLSFDERKK